MCLYARQIEVLTLLEPPDLVLAGEPLGPHDDRRARRRASIGQVQVVVRVRDKQPIQAVSAQHLSTSRGLSDLAAAAHL